MIIQKIKKDFILILFILFLAIFQSLVDIDIIKCNQNIVNIGIKNHGMKYLVPKLITKTTMNNLLLFTPNDNIILNNYTLIKKNNSKYVKLYQINKVEEIYILNSITDYSQKELASNMINPLTFVYSLENMSDDDLNMFLENIFDRKKINTFTFFTYINAGQRQDFLNKFLHQNIDRNGLMKNAIIDEYHKFDIKESKLSFDYIIKEVIRLITNIMILIGLYVINKKQNKYEEIKHLLYANILFTISLSNITSNIITTFSIIILLLLEFLLLVISIRYNKYINHPKKNHIIPFSSSIIQMFILIITIIITIINKNTSTTIIPYAVELLLAVYIIVKEILCITKILNEGSLINGQKNN